MRILLTLVVLFASAVSAQALNRWVTIENISGITMREFYASNRDQRTWGRDWFGPDVLPSGYERQFNLDDGSGYCVWDLKAVMSDGQEVTRMGLNVCEIGRWTIN